MNQNYDKNIKRLKHELETCDAVLVGAGAGLSTSAGFTYSGERFERYFFDFAKKFGISDMYSGGFYPFPDDETRWAWWADYFVLTTNVDPQFRKAGFDKKRLFYTQGDYGLFQSVNSAIKKTFDNEEWVMKAMEAQGFARTADGIFEVPENKAIAMRIPTALIPKCAVDGSDMTTNLRSDYSFVEDEGWHRASDAYSDFVRRHKGLHILYLELGVGANTPVLPDTAHRNRQKRAKKQPRTGDLTILDNSIKEGRCA